MPTAIVFITNLDAHDFPDSAALRRAMAPGHAVYIAWFRNENSGTDAELLQVERELRVTQLAVVADGAIYRVDPS